MENLQITHRMMMTQIAQHLSHVQSVAQQQPLRKNIDLTIRLLVSRKLNVQSAEWSTAIMPTIFLTKMTVIVQQRFTVLFAAS
jgi:hypothetical protein